MDSEERVRRLTAKGYVTREQAELIARAIAEGSDSRRAMDALLQQVCPTVFLTLLKKIGNYSDAEDCMQDAGIVIARRLQTFEGESAFTTWCTGIANNVARQFFRKRRRRDNEVSWPEEEDGPNVVPDDAQRPDEIVEQDLIKELLMECVDFASLDLRTGNHDPLNLRVAHAWIRAFIDSPDATLEDVGEECECNLNKADRVRRKLQRCIQAKDGMGWIAKRIAELSARAGELS